MHELLCLCDELTPAPTRTRVVVLRHQRERWRRTNTAVLVGLTMSNAQVCVWHSRTSTPVPAPDWGEGRERVLLFPGEDGPTVTAAELADRADGITLVVPDGTWTQVRKIVGPSSDLRRLPRLQLPAHAAARWSLREETRAGGMATMDAISHAIEAMEGPDAAAPLNRGLRSMVERVLATRGTPMAGGRDMTTLLRDLGHDPAEVFKSS